jgi:RND family efflux transporter MFP subunit
MNIPRKVPAFAAGILVVCLLLAALLAAMASPNEPEAAAVDVEGSPSRLTVHSVAARVEQWPAAIEAFGNVVAWEEIIVSAQIDGAPLVDLRANVGDQARRGQVLARFDTAKLLAEVRRLRAEVDQARAELAQADVERDRIALLGASGAVSKQEILQRATAAQVASARLGAANASLSARELDLRRADVVAPDDGTISARNAQAGMVGASGLELFRIIRHDRLEWRGELTASQLARAKPGQQVTLSLPDGSSVRALVRHLAPAMNSQTRLGTLYADIESGGTARAGTYVNGRVILGQSAALIVPASGIVVRDGRSFVFKVTGSDVQRVSQQPVEVGRRRGVDAEILSGLVAGDRVVARGGGFLDDGDHVRVVAQALP